MGRCWGRDWEEMREGNQPPNYQDQDSLKVGEEIGNRVSLAVLELQAALDLREEIIKLSKFFSFRFQSERESGDRNFAIGYYLKEKKVFKFLFLFKVIFV